MASSQDMKGWLKKASPSNFKKWDKRFFSLLYEDKRLYYYKKEGDKPIDFIELVDVEAIVAKDPSSTTATDFVIRVIGREYVLRAETAAVMNDWVTRLNNSKNGVLTPEQRKERARQRQTAIGLAPIDPTRSFQEQPAVLAATAAAATAGASPSFSQRPKGESGRERGPSLMGNRRQARPQSLGAPLPHPSANAGSGHPGAPRAVAAAAGGQGTTRLQTKPAVSEPLVLPTTTDATALNAAMVANANKVTQEHERERRKKEIRLGQIEQNKASLGKLSKLPKRVVGTEHKKKARPKSTYLDGNSIFSAFGLEGTADGAPDYSALDFTPDDPIATIDVDKALQDPHDAVVVGADPSLVRLSSLPKLVKRMSTSSLKRRSITTSALSPASSPTATASSPSPLVGVGAGSAIPMAVARAESPELVSATPPTQNPFSDYEDELGSKSILKATRSAREKVMDAEDLRAFIEFTNPHASPHAMEFKFAHFSLAFAPPTPTETASWRVLEADDDTVLAPTAEDVLVLESVDQLLAPSLNTHDHRETFVLSYSSANAVVLQWNPELAKFLFVHARDDSFGLTLGLGEFMEQLFPYSPFFALLPQPTVPSPCQRSLHRALETINESALPAPIKTLFLNLRLAVSNIIAYFFSQYSKLDFNHSLEDLSDLGSELRQPRATLSTLVRGKLCGCLARILSHRFDSFTLWGKHFVFDFLTAAGSSYDGATASISKTSLLLASTLTKIENDARMSTKPSVRLRAFIVAALNKRSLRTFLEAALANQAQVARFYWDDAAIVVGKDLLAMLLRPLDYFVFALHEDLELKKRTPDAPQ